MDSVDDRWYKDAVLYEVSVRTFADGNGDGVGDFRGLTERLDYLEGLGVTAIWLLPFQPSPWRDDGYDVTDHYGVHPDFGDIGDFVRFVEHARDRGLRVIVDLVLNNTSSEHRWFQAARRRDPRFHDYYVWADTKPPDAEKGVVFPGVQKTTWTYDRAARQYYFHRFYDFQPDLNVANPSVRDEMEKIIGFWLNLGISGFRVDAVPFLFEPVSATSPSPGGPELDWLGTFRAYLSWRAGDAVLLGEANVPRESIPDYFGATRLHMLFNFEVNQRLWLALAREEAAPLVEALRDTSGIPGADQWATFLRNNDELDLGRLSDDERRAVFRRFAPSKRMQLYDRGIRRRLAPMLGGDRARLELAFSLLVALPGTPVLFYGDEIGMGDDLALPERLAVRTPMQWSPAANAGFSTAPRSQLALPVVSRGAYAYREVNVAVEQRDDGSLLRFVQRAIRTRRRLRELKGAWEPLRVREPSVLALRYEVDGSKLVALHNLSASPVQVHGAAADGLVDVFANRAYPSPRRAVELDGHGFRWLRDPDAA
jgi:maltose alpha-D-glucosyltransferase/alpha-amylase